MIFAHHPAVARLAALHNAGVDVFEADTLQQALGALRGFGIQHLFVEGGARLAQQFLREGLVDRLIIFQSPITLDDAGLSPFTGLSDDLRSGIDRARVVRKSDFGEDTMTEYALREV
jgi:diaminohydroxyphosphoribosylaminopyrimidine deaminase/5-amino-6-(5-phosphoribosylamino)uracil reductase